MLIAGQWEKICLITRCRMPGRIYQAVTIILPLHDQCTHRHPVFVSWNFFHRSDPIRSGFLIVWFYMQETSNGDSSCNSVRGKFSQVSNVNTAFYLLKQEIRVFFHCELISRSGHFNVVFTNLRSVSGTGDSPANNIARSLFHTGFHLHPKCQISDSYLPVLCRKQSKHNNRTIEIW